MDFIHERHNGEHTASAVIASLDWSEMNSLGAQDYITVNDLKGREPSPWPRALWSAALTLVLYPDSESIQNV